jgi:hypothetical protein
MDLALLLERTPLKGDTDAVIKLAHASFDEACATWKQDFSKLKSAWVTAVASGAKNSTLNAIHYQAKALWQTETIAVLAEERFLPRYGFPINVQALTVQTDRAEEPVQFQRSSILALSEYVPGSTLLGGGKSYSSHGVLSFWSEAANRSFGLRKYLYHCVNGHQWTELQPLAAEVCPLCQARLAHSKKGSIAECVGEEDGGRRRSVEKSKCGTFPPRLEIPGRASGFPLLPPPLPRRSVC